MKRFLLLTTICLLVLGSSLELWAQTSCPTGTRRAPGFLTVDPATGNTLAPVCTDNATGQYVFQMLGLSLTANTTLIFEGATDDAFETTLTVTDPTVDVTVTIPNAASGAISLGQVEATFHDEVTGNATDRTFFIATRGYIVTACSNIFSVTAGGASKLQVTLETGTGAPGTGTDLLTNNANAGFDLALTANTTQVGTLVPVGSRTMVAGDRLSVDYANLIGTTAGNMVTCSLSPN